MRSNVHSEGRALLTVNVRAHLMVAPPNTATDNRWAVFALFVIVLCVGGCIFVAAAYVTPAVLGSSNAAPRQGIEKVVEGLLLFGGMAFGLVLAIVAIAFATRRLVDSQTFDRWSAQIENPEL